jgi:capsid portal protein
MSGKANRTALEIADEKTIGNKRALRAIIIGVDKVADTDAESKEILNDPFKDLYGEGVGQAITPPYNLRLLSMLYENSTELGQCLDAMEVNIEGFGYHLKQLVKGHDIPEATNKEIEEDATRYRKQWKWFLGNHTGHERAAERTNGRETGGA